MVLASTSKYFNKQGKMRYTARKCYSKCLKQLYIANKRLAIEKQNKTKNMHT